MTDNTDSPARNAKKVADELADKYIKLSLTCISLRARIKELEAENIRLKEFLNDGHSSLMEENEQLRWACAAKDARAALNGEK